LFLPLIFINQPFPSLVQIGFGSLYGLLIGITAWIFFFSALSKVKASIASHLAYAEVLWTIIFGVVIFNETLTWNMLLGGSLIIVSAIFLEKET